MIIIDQFDNKESIERRNAENQAAEKQSQSEQDKYKFSLKSYLNEHPEARDEVISEYADDIKTVIGSLGTFAPAAKLLLKSKSPEIYHNLYGGNGSLQPTDTDFTELSHETDGRSHERRGIPRELWQEILEYMSELDEDGWKPGQIADQIYDEYGIELHPLSVKSHIMQYQSSMAIEKKLIASRGEKQPGQSLGIYQKLLSENKQLKEAAQNSRFETFKLKVAVACAGLGAGVIGLVAGILL